MSLYPPMRFGETHVYCPSNHSGFNSHIHINGSAQDIGRVDSNWLNDVAQGELIADDLPPMFEQIWNKNTVPFFLLILFPLISLRSVTFFTKFNSIGKCQDEIGTLFFKYAKAKTVM